MTMITKGETEELIKRLHGWPRPDCPLPSEAVADMRTAEDALRSLVLEVERLHTQQANDDEIDDIRQDELDRSQEHIRELEAALAAARNKTIEECAQIADAVVVEYANEYGAADTGAASMVAERIRALATGETKPSEDR